MPAALKPRYETFCQEYVSYPNAAEAARQAGYSELNADKQGWRLLQRPEVAARIAELRAAQAARESLSLDALLSKLEGVYQLAQRGGQTLAAARIVEVQARLAGFLAPMGANRTKGDAARSGPSDEAHRAALQAVARAQARRRAAAA